VGTWILVPVGINLSSNLSFLKLKTLLSEEIHFDILRIFLTGHYVRLRDLVERKYTDNRYVPNQEIPFKYQIGHDLVMVSCVYCIIRGCLMEFNKCVSQISYKSIKTASPQILYKAFKSRTFSMYGFNFQDYKIKYTDFLSDKSALEDSFEGYRCCTV
jgi:hypothetical protein